MLRHHTEPDALVLTPDGSIHTDDVPDLLVTAGRLLDDEPRGAVVLDLSLLRLPGLAAIDALMRLHLIVRRRGRALTIRHVPGSLRRALERAGVTTTLPLRRSCDCRVCHEERP